MDIDIKDLLAIIGELEVANRLLKRELAAMKAVPPSPGYTVSAMQPQPSPEPVG